MSDGPWKVQAFVFLSNNIHETQVCTKKTHETDIFFHVYQYICI